MSLGSLLLHFAILVLVAAAVVRLRRARHPALWALGVVGMVLASLYAALVSRAISRWGVLRPGEPFQGFSTASVWLILGTLDVMVVGTMIVVDRIGRSQRRS